MPNVQMPVVPGFAGPFSGDVSQQILPWTWNFGSSRLSFISVDLGRSRAPEMERAILDDVGSYGRQIGRIADALEVLLDRLDRASLAPPEREAVDSFRGQLAEVRRIKTAMAR